MNILQLILKITGNFLKYFYSIKQSRCATLILQLIEVMIGNIKPFQKRKVESRDPTASFYGADSPMRFIESQANTINRLCEKIEDLLGAIDTNGNSGKNEKQTRDREIKVKVPLLSNNQKQKHIELKKWTSYVCEQVVSATFNLFYNRKMDQKKAKVYCSENLLKNILQLTKKNKISESDFQVINSSLRETIKYYLLKYPQTEGTLVNKKFQKQILMTNILDSNINNLIINSGVLWTYREQANYNDCIMKFINHLLQLVDEKDDEGKSRFNRFEQMFEKIFTGPEERVWVEDFQVREFQRDELLEKRKQLEQKLQFFRKTIQKNQQHRKEAEEYQNRVRSYSKYLISRKIAQNTPGYSNKEIFSGNLSIKSTPVLRILNKWCEQLQKKYIDEQYFLNRDEDIILQRGSFTTFTSENKQRITDLIQEEKKEIETHLKRIRQNNYKNQSKNSYQKLKEDNIHYIGEQEKVMGKFVGKSVSCLETYITSYLNKLIHGLLKAASQFYDKDVKMYRNWSSPPQLLTFLTGDLMRCRYASQQKEVIRVYKELEMISHLYPEKFKIVRIKNRLNLGTRDILINAKFQDKILCEIQLAINSSARDDFIYHSDKFNHYLYQLRRALLGPVSQLCSIWSANDQRFQAFTAILEAQKNIHPPKQEPSCKQATFFKQQLPFECSLCGNFVTKNKYLLDNVKCQGQEYWKCGKCEMEDFQYDQLLQKIRSSKKNVRLPQKMRKVTNNQIPKYGVYINMESKNIFLNRFKTIMINKTIYLFNKENNSLVLLEEFKKNSKKIDNFFSSNIVFECSVFNHLNMVTTSEIRKQFLIKNYLKNVYRNKKEVINIEKQNAQEEDILNVPGNQGEKRIYLLSLRDNNIEQLKELALKFPNLKFLTLNQNRVKSIEGIGDISKLVRIRLMNNKIKQIPRQIKNCVSLQKISLQTNELQFIPAEIGALIHLEELWLDNNKITEIPRQIGQMKSLLFLVISNNKLNFLPSEIGNLSKLKYLRLDSNNLSSLPDELGDLKQLQTLILNSNKLNQLPETIKEMTSLQMIYISKNNIQNVNILSEIRTLQEIRANNNRILQIPEKIHRVSPLRVLAMSNNKIKGVPYRMNALSKLKELNLSDNEIQKVHNEVGLIQNLHSLNLARNQIKILPPTIHKLIRLEKLDIDNNEIEVFPYNFYALTNLESFSMKNNKFKEFPVGIEQMKSLKKFSFTNNSLEKLPEDFDSLRSLQELSFGNRELNLDSEELKTLHQLNKLSIQNSNLVKIPHEIMQLKKVIQLNLTKNSIVEIPREIQGLPSLKVLQLSHNQINKIDENITLLRNLNELQLQFNNLTQIPQCIVHIRNLRILNISNNKIQCFPYYLEKLTTISKRFLRFSNNPIKEVECVEFLMGKASKKSQEFLESWVAKHESLEIENEDLGGQQYQNQQEEEIIT